jgi:beta-glucanase (GH16 family)
MATIRRVAPAILAGLLVVAGLLIPSSARAATVAAPDPVQHHLDHLHHLAHLAHLKVLGITPSASAPAPAGWKLTYSQDFSGTALPAGWGAYQGQPGGDPDGYWLYKNVSVSGGYLNLTTTPNSDPQRAGTATSGGVSSWGHAQTYGLYLVRMKGDSEPGLNMSDILILWPQNNQWPPEIDFYEDSGGARQGYAATLHPGPNGDNCCTIQESFANDATVWHTYGVAWTPSSLVYTIDGKTVGTVNRSQLTGAAQWPSIPMVLDIQSQNLGSAQPGATTTMQIDWVKEYAQS